MHKYFYRFCVITIICTFLVGCNSAASKPSDPDPIGTPMGSSPNNQDQIPDNLSAGSQIPDNLSAGSQISDNLSADSQNPDDFSADSQKDDLPTSYVYTTKDHIFPMSESITVDGIAYQVLECKVTSEFGDRNIENLNYFFGDDGIDRNGNLINEENYVFLTIQFTNTTDSEQEILRNSKGIYFMDEHYIIRDYTCDSVYIDEYWLGGTNSEFFHYKLAPGESITSEVGWVVAKKTFEDYDKLYFAVKQDGNLTDFGGTTDPNAVFIDLAY